MSKELLEKIAEKDIDIAAEIKRLMFMFDDLINIQDKDLQKILREVDRKELVLSLKIADEKLKEKIYSNMSERAANLLKEELQYMGMVKLKEVEAAQANIIATVKRLEEDGEISLNIRGSKEEVYV
jgi:flagellar motor switch protein FliG